MQENIDIIVYFSKDLGILEIVKKKYTIYNNGHVFIVNFL